MEDSKAVMQYWLLLKDLSPEAKWDILELLVKSVKVEMMALKAEAEKTDKNSDGHELLEQQSS